MATGDIYVRVGGVEYGSTVYALGTHRGVQSFDIEPSGPFQRGSARIKIISYAGGFTFLPANHVQIYVNIGGTYRALFGGFVKDVSTTQQQTSSGQFLVVYTLTCVDYNELLDELVQQSTVAIEGDGTSATWTFQSHIQRICRYVTTGGYVSANFDTSGVGLSGTYSNGSGFRTFFYAGMSLREMLQTECNHYQQDIDTTARPRFWMSPPTSGVTSTGWANSAALLNIVDGNINPAAGYHFHDGSGSGGTLIKVQGATRHLDGTRLTTRVDANGQVGGLGFTRSALADTTATYPNPYDTRVITFVTQNAWNGKPLDGGTLNSAAELQALADRHVAARKAPRETIEIKVQNNSIDPLNVMPGATSARVTWAVWPGVTNYDLRIMGSKITALYDNTGPYMSLVYALQLGNKILELGDSDDDITQVPVVNDTTGPNPPTSGSVTTNRWNGRYQGADVVASFTASTSPDVEHYTATVTQGTFIRVFGDIRGTSTPVMPLYPGVSTDITITAWDTSGNPSQSVLTIATFTTAASPATRGLYNGDFAVVSPFAATKPDGWTETTFGTGAGVLTSAPTAPKLHQALLITCNTTVAIQDTDTWRSQRVQAVSVDSVTGTQFQYAARAVYGADVTTGTLQVAVEHYNISGTILRTDNLYSGSTPASVSTKTRTGTCPTGTVEIGMLIKGTGPGSVGTVNITIGACELGPASVSSGSGAGALATTDTTGQLAVPTVAGTPTGVPDLDTNSVGMEIDSTNQRLAAYITNQWFYASMVAAPGGRWEPLTDGAGNIIFTDGDVVVVPV